MDYGWISLYRKLLQWEWYQDSYTLHIFIHLLLKANHKDGRWRGVDIKRGQLVTSRRTLSIETGISEQSVRTSLGRLESTGEITIKSTSKFTIITLCKYTTYQLLKIKINQQSTSNQPAINQQSTTNNNEDKENKGIIRVRNTFVPPSLDDIKTYIAEKNYTTDPLSFYNYFSEGNWTDSKGNKVKNWKQKLITWESHNSKKKTIPAVGIDKTLNNWRKKHAAI